VNIDIAIAFLCSVSQTPGRIYATSRPIKPHRSLTTMD